MFYIARAVFGSPGAHFLRSLGVLNCGLCLAQRSSSDILGAFSDLVPVAACCKYLVFRLKQVICYTFGLTKRPELGIILILSRLLRKASNNLEAFCVRPVF